MATIKTTPKATPKTTRQAAAKPARKIAGKPPQSRAKATKPASSKPIAAKRSRAVKTPDITPEAAPQLVPTSAPAHTLREPSKGSLVLKLLGAEAGTTLTAIMTATGWQAHTVRGFIAGTVKGKLKLNVLSERVDGERTYRIAVA